MGLRHAVLASLLEGDAAGYELSKRFDVSVANFWSATPQQLYRELERLESEGFVEGRVVEQQRRPNKRVFSLTRAGRVELRGFIAQPTRPGAMRDDLLVKLQAAGPDDLPAVRKAVEERLHQAREKLAFYDHLHDGLLDGSTEAAHVAEAERIGPYLTLMGGRLYEQANIRWCESVLAVLDERSPAPDGRSPAPGGD